METKKPTNRKKIAFALSHLGLRIDLRRLLTLMHDAYDLDVFVRREDVKYLADTDLNIKVVDDLFPLNATDDVKKGLFRWVGQMPRPAKYFKEYILRKADRSEGSSVKRRMELLFAVNSRLPVKWSYFNYLKSLGVRSPLLQDYDMVLSVTDAVSDKMLGSVINSGVPLSIYVTSWDHAAKFRTFANRYVDYLVWGERMAEDLIELHGVAPKNTVKLGCGQFFYLAQFIRQHGRKADPTAAADPYIYVPASFAYPLVARQEVNVIAGLSDYLTSIDSNLRIVFRPYPMLSDQQLYEPLRRRSNISFDKFTVDKAKPNFKTEDLEHKYRMIHAAAAVFHVATTLGLEAAYFDVPVFVYRGSDFDNTSIPASSRLSVSLDQYHLRKYFSGYDSPNIIQSAKAFRTITDTLASDPEKGLAYNRLVRQHFDLNSTEEFFQKLNALLFWR